MITKVSIQAPAATGVVCASGTRQNFEDFAVQWVTCFGPVDRVSCPTAAAVPGSMHAFLQP